MYKSSLLLACKIRESEWNIMIDDNQCNKSK